MALKYPALWRRNTSAYAEKTYSLVRMCVEHRKHLRLRGENADQPRCRQVNLETPPLTRRKLRMFSKFNKNARNTSAYAEKTAAF